MILPALAYSVAGFFAFVFALQYAWGINLLASDLKSRALLAMLLLALAYQFYALFQSRGLEGLGKLIR